MAVDVVNDTLNSKLSPAIKSAAVNVVTQTLLHELQLGEQLNECVHQARRADFSLMLAMLSEDVREQSQFILPQQHDDSIAKVNVSNNEALRKHFDLPEQAPLALKKIEQIKQYNQMQSLIDDDISNLHLMNALSPKPLAFRDDSKHIASEIMTNTSEICQAKHALETINPVLNQRLNMNVEGWLKVVQTSLVKSILVNNLNAA